MTELSPVIPVGQFSSSLKGLKASRQLLLKNSYECELLNSSRFNFKSSWDWKCFDIFPWGTTMSFLNYGGLTVQIYHVYKSTMFYPRPWVHLHLPIELPPSLSSWMDFASLLPWGVAWGPWPLGFGDAKWTQAG